MLFYRKVLTGSLIVGAALAVSACGPVEEEIEVPELTDAEVEAVARAIYEDCGGWFDHHRLVMPQDLIDTARAAIIALDEVRGR